MKNDLLRHKKSDFLKWIIAFALIAVLFVGMFFVILQTFTPYKPSDWFKSDTEDITSIDESDDFANKSICAMSANFRSSKEDAEIEIESFYNGTIIRDASFLSQVTLKNNINSTTTNFDVRFSVANVGMQGVWLFIPKNNPFSDLENYEVSTVDLTMDGTDRDCFYQNVLPNYYPYNLAMGGYFSGMKIPEINVTYNLVKSEKKPVPLPPDPVKEGYNFIGWYYDSDFTRVYDGQPIYADTELYARFEIKRFWVTFNSDGGEEIESRKVDWNTTLTPPTPERIGYTFKGWYLSDGTKYENQPIKIDIELTAQWEIIMCTVTFYIDGEVYETKQVEYGTSFVELVEIANELNLCVLSISSANENIGNSEMENMIVTDDNIELHSKELTGVDKVINTAINNKWAIIGGITGGLVILAMFAAIVGSRKLKKR